MKHSIVKTNSGLLCAVVLLIVLSLGESVEVQAQSKFDRMISPVSNPMQFEDPRARSEARLIYMYHEIKDELFGEGGDLQVFQVQLRVAVNDDLTLLLSKAGFYDLNPDGDLSSESGPSNLTLGFKHTLAKNAYTGTLLTGGVKFEFPVGDDDVFQGEGDGILNPFLSGAATFNRTNFMAATGFRFPVDGDDSTFYDLDLHFDFPMGALYPSFDLNMIYVIDSGKRFLGQTEGLDLINFGSNDSDGEAVVTTTIGGRYRFNDHIDWGLGYTLPISSGTAADFIDWRLSTDLILSIP